MPIQSLWSAPPIDLASPETRREGLRGVVLVLATLALTLPAVRALFAVLRVDGVTALDVGILIAFALLFAWIALSFVSAVAGLAVGRMEEADPCLDPETTPPNLNARTAILLPIYNEPPRAAFARLRAMARSLEAAGATEAFDIFVLSDTTRKDVQAAECALFHPLRAEVGVAVYYRHRARNTDRKAGNIADWVRRFGGAYAHMVVLDADSLMSGDTLVRLAAAMERNPRLGLLQTTPVLVNLNSLLARAQQFASRLYGPLLSRGIAWWSGGQGNYWGHNAIIRVRAFAEQAGLPHLPGRKPFGGHIMSHDFVEAALMRRAGWEVRMAPLLGGSYEETPPTLSDLIARDRRWCQGNLQHLMVLPSRGLHWISRLHLLRGVSSYLTAPIWLALLVMGVILALRPDLGVAGWSHARGDGAVAHADSGAVLGIFAISMGFLLAPKLMAFAAMLADPDERRAFGGARRAFGGLMLEMALSTLIAPILMLNQVRALASILAGRDSGWPAQSRDEGRVSLAEAARRHLGDTLAGLALAAAALWAAPDLLLWMSPVVAGLIGAIPVAMLSARRDLGLKARRAGLLLIPEETSPPPVIVHLNALLTRPPEPTPHATPRRAPVAAEPLFS